MARIRADEARNVRVSRDLARLLAPTPRCCDWSTPKFATPFAPYWKARSAFEAMGVDHPHLNATISP